MTRIIKLLFERYQDIMYYVSLTKGEYGKIGSLVPETISIVTLLKVSGVNVRVWQIMLSYLFIIMVATLIGLFLDHWKIPHYNTRLANKRNPEFLDMMARLERIEKNQKGGGKNE